MTTQDHIHLLSYAGAAPAHDLCKYSLLMPGVNDKLVTAAVGERGLDGVLGVHRLVDIGGNTVTFRDGQLRLLVDAQTVGADGKTELARLKGLSGQTCYYIPLQHESGISHVLKDNANGYKVLLIYEGGPHVDPVQQYWTVQITLMEDTLA